VAENLVSSVYSSVSIEILPAPDLYVIEFTRHSGDLGVSVILPATCAPMARLEAWRLFPEHKRHASRTFVFSVEYAEIDWNSGQCYVKKRQREASIPVLFADEPKEKPKRKRRTEDGSTG
jgi:hypothetical protein